MNIVYRILVAVAAIFVIAKYITPLLKGFMDPLGLIILIVLYVVVLFYLMKGTPAA